MAINAQGVRKFCSVIILAALLSVLVATPAYAASCSAAAHNPHYSTGAGGIIAKGQGWCDNLSSGDDIKVEVVLFLCDHYPSVTESYLQNNCTEKGHGIRTIYNATSGKKYTEYAPPSYLGGAHGTGYWVACSVTHLRYDGTSSWIASDLDFSQVKWLSG